MLFHVFGSQEERRKFGSSAFIELQFCKLPPKAKIKKIVSTNSITHWQNDSLYVYVDDIDTFFKEYAPFFNSGTYSNLETGVVDLFGINYYAPSAIDSLIAKICECRPVDYESLVNWLSEGKAYNGFYILGI